MYYFFSKLLAPFLKLTNLFIFLIIVLVILQKFFPKNYIKLIRNLIITLFIIICIFPVGNLGLKYLEKSYIDQQAISNIDNIVVLAGSENVQLTKISSKLSLNDSSERLIASVKLANQYNDSKIYFLGGDGNLIKNSIDETSVAFTFYKDVGFDVNRVYFINNTRNTYENLKEFKQFSKKDERNILITSAFHMKRSILISEKLKMKFIPYAADYRSTNSNSIINYYQSFSITSNLVSFDIFFNEILGILAIKLFY